MDQTIFDDDFYAPDFHELEGAKAAVRIQDERFLRECGIKVEDDTTPKS